jgi:hypothetical protein
MDVNQQITLSRTDITARYKVLFWSVRLLNENFVAFGLETSVALAHLSPHLVQHRDGER